MTKRLTFVLLGLLCAMALFGVSDKHSGSVARAQDAVDLPPPPPVDTEDLLDTDSVNVVDPDQQISVSGGGGGACQRLGASLVYEETAWSNYFCLITSFPVGARVTLTIYQPDGSLYARENLTVEQGDGQADTTNHYLSGVAFPTYTGLPLGTWAYSATYNGRRESRQYELRLWDREPALLYRCNGTTPNLILMGFAANQIINLRLESITGDPDLGKVIDGETTARTIMHWRIRFGTQSYVVLTPRLQLDPRNGYFFTFSNETNLYIAPYGWTAKGVRYKSCGQTQNSSTGGSAGNNTNAAGQCPGSPAPRLHIGGRGRILPGDPNWLNTLPMRPSLHPESKRLVLVPVGAVFDVLDGPVCADGITWWKVRYKGTVGWTGESDTGYWAEPN